MHERKKFFLGAHMSVSGGFVKMLARAETIGCNTMQFFVRNPRGGKAVKSDPDDLAEFRRLLSKKNFGKIIAHAPYTMNVCSPKEDIREFGAAAMAEDLRLMEHFPGNYYNFHPGSAVGQDEVTAENYIAEALNRVLPDVGGVTVLLETMAGKGSEIGKSFEQLYDIIDKTRFPEKLGVCLDTCHVWDAGYDIVGNLDAVLAEFDRIIGLDRLKAVHLNDSLNPLGSRKDRHALIGEGYIGFDALCALVRNSALSSLPVVLETPTDDVGHGKELLMLRERLEESSDG